MNPKLTPEQRTALEQNAGQPIRMEDDVTHQIYLVIKEEDFGGFWEEYIRREVQRGLDAIDRGEIEEWEIDSVKAEGRHLLNPSAE